MGEPQNEAQVLQETEGSLHPDLEGWRRLLLETMIRWMWMDESGGQEGGREGEQQGKAAVQREGAMCAQN